MLRFLSERQALLKRSAGPGYSAGRSVHALPDAAVEQELQRVKELGFNLLRKRQDEPQRWYYHCDRLGLVVWADMVNGGAPYKLWFVTYLTNALLPLYTGWTVPPAARLLWAGRCRRPDEYRRELTNCAPLHWLLGPLQRGMGALRCRSRHRRSAATGPPPLSSEAEQVGTTRGGSGARLRRILSPPGSSPAAGPWL